MASFTAKLQCAPSPPPTDKVVRPYRQNVCLSFVTSIYNTLGVSCIMNSWLKDTCNLLVEQIINPISHLCTACVYAKGQLRYLNDCNRQSILNSLHLNVSKQNCNWNRLWQISVALRLGDVGFLDDHGLPEWLERIFSSCGVNAVQCSIEIQIDLRIAISLGENNRTDAFIFIGSKCS